jgi:hypothetical protein
MKVVYNKGIDSRVEVEGAFGERTGLRSFVLVSALKKKDLAIGFQDFGRS